jgi:FAD/FMN-containing dehydrogenase
MNSWSNWSGGVRATPAAIATPASETELTAIVRAAAKGVRVAGSGHSFTPICQTSGTLISLDGMQGIVSVDAVAQTATVKAGTKIHALGRPLFDAGFGLNDHIAVNQSPPQQGNQGQQTGRGITSRVGNQAGGADIVFVPFG